MIGIVILGCYLTGWVVAWRIAFVGLAEYWMKDDLPMDHGERVMTAALGGMLALAWPLLALAYIPYRLAIARPTPTEQRQADEQQQQRERRELERLRALAMEYGLPLEPGDHEVPRA